MGRKVSRCSNLLSKEYIKSQNIAAYQIVFAKCASSGGPESKYCIR